MITMKTRSLLVPFILVLFSASFAWADPPSLVGRLNLAEGAVSFRPGSLDEWAPAVLNYPLTAGDHVWADEGGRAEIHVGSAAVRLDGGTEMSFLNLDDQTVQIAVSQGQLNVRLRRLDPGDAFEIDTPNSVFTLLQPGSYSVSVQSEEGSSLTVWNGQAEVTAAGNDFMVPAGQVANVSGLGSIAYYTQPVASPEAWDAWCAARDDREEQLVSVRYVPRDMIGVEDLDANGSWTVMAGYGPVWAPSRVPPGWAPYKLGRWAWVAPWGWTWIDEAPWGFAPFHYGRWAFVNTRWFWIPGTVVARPVYAPALVVFIGGGPEDPSADGIGWFPLGPSEVYVPPYGASTTYVQRINVTNVTIINVQIIERIDVTRVTYVNREAPSAVTMVPRQSFAAGRPANGAPVFYSTEQVRRSPVLGMGATIAPQRESVIGQSFVSRTPAPQPPPQVAGRSVYGRIAPAPAPAPFMFRPDPLPPATVYQRPTQQVAPPPVGPQRQQAPILINPQIRTPNSQLQQQFRPQPQQGPVLQAQQGQVLQAPPPRQPGQVIQPARPMTPQQQQPLQPQPMQPQPMQPRQPLNQQAQQQPPVVQAQPQGPGGQQLQPRGPGGQQLQPQGPGGQQLQPQGPGGQQPQGGREDQGGGKPAKDNQGNGEARSLLNQLKLKTLPGVQQHLDSARKAPGAKLDSAALTQRINAARSAISAAEKTLATGKSDAALQQAQAVQKQLADLDRLISEAAKASGEGDSGDQQRRNPPGQGQGDAPANRG